MSVTHHTIAIHQVDRVLQGARAQGLDVPALLASAGIAPALLDAPAARVSQAQYALLLRRLRHATRDELWGLASRPVPLGSFALCCRALVQCRTLGEAMHLGFRHYHLLLPDLAPRLHPVPPSAALPADLPRRVRVTVIQRHARDDRLDYLGRVFLFFTFGLASWLVARRVPLLGVDYRSAPPPREMEASRIFQAPLQYQQPHVGFVFDAHWLDLPVVQTAQSLRDFLALAPHNLLVRYRDQTSATERLRRLLRAHLSGELPSLDAVSSSLAMTPQTLRRRLREEGRGFQQLKDDLRRDAAIEFLALPDLTLIDIANRLGFSEASTFHRAFKKWTGVAPGEYRQVHLVGRHSGNVTPH